MEKPALPSRTKLSLHLVHTVVDFFNVGGRSLIMILIVNGSSSDDWNYSLSHHLLVLSYGYVVKLSPIIFNFIQKNNDFPNMVLLKTK